MVSKIIAVSAATALALSSVAAAQNDTGSGIPGLSQTAQLQLADTAIDRYALLPNDDDFVFDFNKDKLGIANRKNFPALVGTGSAMATAEIPGCGMASLHIHPRSAELFIALTGRVYTETFLESGAVNAEGEPRVVRTELGPGQMTVFPAGSFHTQMNPDCEPALTVASFAHEDPGASLVAAGTFALSDDFVGNSFGGAISGDEIDKIRGAIPPGALFLVDECRAKCGDAKRK